MKVVWVTRSFLDYRIPVFRELNGWLNGRLALLFNADYVPERCCRKARETLGPRARGLRGESAIKWGVQNGFANQGMRIPYQRGLVKAILEEEPDVLISDGFFQWTYAALWLRAMRGIPHVMCYERTSHTERRAQWFRQGYRRLVLRWVDAMCCNGRLCGEYAQSLGFPSELITYGHMAADVEGMQCAASSVSPIQVDELRRRLGLRGLVVLYVGQLTARKGIDKLLAAWRLLARHTQHDQATLLLVGEGSQRGALEQYCAIHCLRNVRFTGAVDYDAMAPFYRTADLFVIPTLEDNWSLVVPEAMACSLPIMCSKYNGCWPELVRSTNGWVFDPLDPCATAKTLEVCLRNRSQLSAMGACSKVIVAEHSADRAAQAILKACGIALGEHVMKVAEPSLPHLPR